VKGELLVILVLNNVVFLPTGLNVKKVSRSIILFKIKNYFWPKIGEMFINNAVPGDFFIENSRNVSIKYLHFESKNKNLERDEIQLDLLKS